MEILKSRGQTWHRNISRGGKQRFRHSELDSVLLPEKDTALLLKPLGTDVSWCSFSLKTSSFMLMFTFISVFEYLIQISRKMCETDEDWEHFCRHESLQTWHLALSSAPSPILYVHCLLCLVLAGVQTMAAPGVGLVVLIVVIWSFGRECSLLCVHQIAVGVYWQSCFLKCFHCSLRNIGVSSTVGVRGVSPRKSYPRPLLVCAARADACHAFCQRIVICVTVVPHLFVNGY